jgi:hypothetical protein
LHSTTVGIDTRWSAGRTLYCTAFSNTATAATFRVTEAALEAWQEAGLPLAEAAQRLIYCAPQIPHMGS